MHPLAKKLLMLRKIEFGEEGLKILSHGAIILPTEFCVHTDLNSKKEEIGRAIGKGMIKILNSLGLADAKEQAFNFASSLFSLFGFGRIELTRDKDVLIVHNSPFANEFISHGKLNKKACEITCGILSEILSFVSEKNISVREVSCKTENGKYCIFSLKEE